MRHHAGARGGRSAMPQLDQLLPRWHHREHHRVAVPAPPEVVLRAVRDVTWREVPVFRALSFVAALGRRRMPGGGPVLEQLLSDGFRLLHDGDGELVVGAIVRVTRPRGSVPLGEEGAAGEFRACHQPGCYKVALGFRAATGSLCTETRVLATDDATRRRIRRHWLLVRLPGGVIRRGWLRAASRRSAGR